MDFSEEQIMRSARHILLPQVGGEGQKKLLNAKVLVIGAEPHGPIISNIPDFDYLLGELEDAKTRVIAYRGSGQK